jgi:signal transduction histidine kinase
MTTTTRPRALLRWRLTFLYTLLTLALTVLLGVMAYFGLSWALERNVLQTLQSNAQAFQARFDDPLKAVQEPSVIASGVYYQLLDQNGTPVPGFASRSLQGLNLPSTAGLTPGGNGWLWVDRTPWLLRGKPSGTILTAVDASDLVQTRNLAAATLALLALLATTLAFPLGYVVGGRALARLELAAERAMQIDPARPEPLNLQDQQDDEVGALVSALDRALSGIRDRQVAERGFLAEIAHELGTPLTVLTAQLERLAEETREPQLVTARDAAWDIARTAEDLLLLARNDPARGHPGPSIEPHLIDLREVIQNVLSEHHDAPIQYTRPTKPLEVIGDPLRLRQIVRNLVRNALRAVAAVTRSGHEPTPGATVRVSLRTEGNQAVLEVLDNGAGILAADLTQIFDRFYSRSGGSGVGLAVVRGLAQAHGGSAEAINNPDGGACFTIRLPLADMDEHLEPPLAGQRASGGS